MQLTRNYFLSEFAVSVNHPELAAQIQFSEAEEIKAYLLCATILQPNCVLWVENMMPYGYGQLILYPKKNFIHVSLPTPKHQGESLEL